MRTNSNWNSIRRRIWTCLHAQGNASNAQGNDTAFLLGLANVCKTVLFRLKPKRVCWIESKRLVWREVKWDEKYENFVPPLIYRVPVCANFNHICTSHLAPQRGKRVIKKQNLKAKNDSSKLKTKNQESWSLQCQQKSWSEPSKLNRFGFTAQATKSSPNSILHPPSSAEDLPPNP